MTAELIENRTKFSDPKQLCKVSSNSIQNCDAGAMTDTHTDNIAMVQTPKHELNTTRALAKL